MNSYNEKTQQLNKLLGYSEYTVPGIEEVYRDIVIRSNHFKPACHRYPNCQPVTCDKCFKKNLMECYSHCEKNFDLCVDCHNEVSLSIFRHNNQTF